jgi:hypothetical protein
MKRVRRGLKKRGNGITDGAYIAGQARFGGSKKLLRDIGNVLKKTKALSTIGKAIVPMIKNKQASNIASQVVSHIEKAGMGHRRGSGMVSSIKKMNAVVKQRVRRALGMGMMSQLKKLHNVVKSNKLISKAGAAVIPMIKNKQIQNIASKAVSEASAQGYGRRRRGGNKATKFFKDVGRVLRKTKLVSTLGKAFAPAATAFLGPESAPLVASALGAASKAGYGKMKRMGYSRNTYGCGVYDYGSQPPPRPAMSGNPYNNVASVYGRPVF